jgi:hypothetical protein
MSVETAEPGMRADRQRDASDWCRALLNVNEFVYLD